MPANKRLILHPIFFVVYPIFFLYSHNKKEVAFSSVISPLLAVAAIAALVWVIFIPCIRHLGKRAVVFSTMVLAFFSYGHIHNFIFGKEPRLWFSLAYLCAVLLLLFMLSRGKTDFPQANRILNLISIALVAFVTLQIAFYEISYRKGSLVDLEKYQVPITADPLKANAGPSKPDIYFLLFDRYGSSEVLAEYFHYDNREFDRFLQEKGFYLARHSKANYPYTFLSLAATFNLQYLDFLFQITGKTDDKTIVYDLIQNASVVKFLKSRGYQYFLLGSWWQPSRKSKYADHIIYLSGLRFFGMALNEFSEKLFRTTFLYHALAHLFQTRWVESVAEPQKILYQFGQLKEIAAIDGPKFVFAHILSTHPPFFFHSDGSLTSPSDRDKTDERTLYLDTVSFTNQKIREVVNDILQRSSRPPIILLQADEGPYGTIIKSKNKWRNPYRRLKLQSGILNAMYLPDFPRDRLYSTISPVNTFRLILNHYFGTSLKPLKDEVYISDHRTNLYQFINVTKRVAYGSISVVTRPAGATISIDGHKSTFQSNHKFWYIKPGLHEVTIEREGYQKYSTTLQVRAGRVSRIKINLKPQSALK